MSAHPETESPEQLNRPGSIFESKQCGCPIIKEISHRLQIPPVIAESESVDVGGVSLKRDDFCPESAHCALCSFVAKIRLDSTNNASLTSVYFVLNKFTNFRLRLWMNTQITGESQQLPWMKDNFKIIVTSKQSAFRTIHWRYVHQFVEKPPNHGSESCILGTIRLWKYQVPNLNLPAPKLDTLTYIATLAKHWLRFCNTNHEDCASLVADSTPLISLIDCNRRCLVHGSQGIRYVALSYVWGKTGRDFNLPDRSYGVPLSRLPRTIGDAITVTKSLGFDYLWVDMLCIDQQSNEDKHRQIAIMDQIYRSADLTIIVAAGSDCGDGIPGVSERCRPPRLSITIGHTILIEEKEDPASEIEASIWRSRGWTFQEGLLSRRRLVFTDSRILFSCYSDQAIEPRLGPEFPQAEENRVFKPPRGLWYDEPRLWGTSFLKIDSPDLRTLGGEAEGCNYRYGFPIALAELLEKYSSRSFSFESDVVDAFRAIGNIFALRTPPVLHLCGLPFIFGNEPTTASSLTRGLAWCLERGDEETARRPGFPSWSWLGYRGPVRWGARLRPQDGSTYGIDEQWSAKTFSHVRSMITIGNRKFELMHLSQWWREWSDAKASEGLAPSRLMIMGSMIKQEVWSGGKCTLYEEWEEPSRYIVSGEGPWSSQSRYKVGTSLMMSEDACQRLLENLRRGILRAVLLTDGFLLIVQPVAAEATGGPYRRVASADIDVPHTKESDQLEMDHFVKECTELVDIELV
ncbi:hypothetical protein LB507_009299 [Fusarium sp. FIESC RH6]|nr:hypothetical protein LB507_009299 [Fusarium sp. FIESC RH6]